MTPASMPIPSFDPIPMPAPEPLVHGLLVVTVLLHALFVNLVLGSTPIMVVTEWLGQRRGSERFQRLARTWSSIIPTAMALAIVLGSRRCSSFRFCTANCSTPPRFWLGGFGFF